MGIFARVLLLLLLPLFLFFFLKQSFSVDGAGLESGDSPASALLMCVIFIPRGWRDGVRCRAACLFSPTCSGYSLSILFVRIWNSYDRFYLMRSHRWVKTRTSRILTGPTGIHTHSWKLRVYLKLVSEVWLIGSVTCSNFSEQVSVYHEAEGFLIPKEVLLLHFVLILKLDQAQGNATCATVSCYVYAEIFLAMTDPA